MVCPTARRVGTCGETTACLCPLPRSKTGSKPGGKKAQARMDTAFLDWALAAFSGYVAADELYDGPFCVLSAVDNRRYKRILYDVLDHDPTHDDIRAFLRRLEAQRAALFTARYLFVQRHLNKTERKTLWRVSRGLPQLGALRAVMDQVYALFDRRCRTQTALDKLAKLRRRLQRFPQVGETLKKLFSPTLDKALTFLDDKLLPSTSNAVERGNRRYRKMQKSVYRVRTQAQIRARLALDMWREAHAEGRQHTLASLHRARTG